MLYRSPWKLGSSRRGEAAALLRTALTKKSALATAIANDTEYETLHVASASMFSSPVVAFAAASSFSPALASSPSPFLARGLNGGCGTCWASQPLRSQQARLFLFWRAPPPYKLTQGGPSLLLSSPQYAERHSANTHREAYFFSSFWPYPFPQKPTKLHRGTSLSCVTQLQQMQMRALEAIQAGKSHDAKRERGVVTSRPETQYNAKENLMSANSGNRGELISEPLQTMFLSSRPLVTQNVRRTREALRLGFSATERAVYCCEYDQLPHAGKLKEVDLSLSSSAAMLLINNATHSPLLHVNSCNGSQEKDDLRLYGIILNDYDHLLRLGRRRRVYRAPTWRSVASPLLAECAREATETATGILRAAKSSGGVDYKEINDRILRLIDSLAAHVSSSPSTKLLCEVAELLDTTVLHALRVAQANVDVRQPERSTEEPCAEKEQEELPLHSELCLLTVIAIATTSLPSSGGGLTEGKVIADDAFTCALATRLGQALYRAIAGIPERRARLLAKEVDKALWEVFVPLVRSLLYPGDTRPHHEKGQPACAKTMATLHDLRRLSLLLCVELSLRWGYLVVPERRRWQRTRAKDHNSAPGDECNAFSQPTLSSLAAVSTSGGSASETDYSASETAACKTVALASLLEAALCESGREQHTASHSTNSNGVSLLIKDSRELTLVCGAVGITVRETDATSAHRLVRALVEHAARLNTYSTGDASGLDARACASIVRVLHVMRLGCSLPEAAAFCFHTAIVSCSSISVGVSEEEKGKLASEAEQQQQWWSAFTARVLACIATSSLPHAERSAMLLRVAARAAAAGIELEATTHLALREGMWFRMPRCFSSITSASRGGGGHYLFDAAPWTDVEASHSAWVSGEHGALLTTGLTVLQRTCARALLASHKTSTSMISRALPYVPAEDIESSLLALCLPSQGNANNSQRGLAAQHALLAYCALCRTGDCRAAAKELFGTLIATASPAVCRRGEYLWRSWYQTVATVQVAAQSSKRKKEEADEHVTTTQICFRPCNGVRFFPTASLAEERESELRVRFEHQSCNSTFLSECCEHLAGHFRVASKPTAPNAVGRCRTCSSQGEKNVGTNYVCVVAALRGRGAE